MRRLVLVRHGESARNVAKRGKVFFDDEAHRSLDPAVADHKVTLTAEGWRQAHATGEALRRLYGAFDFVVHSGYRRTIDTTAGLLDAYPEEERAAMRPECDVFVRERDAGHAFFMTSAEVREHFPWLDAYWRFTGPFFARPPGGESVAQVCERARLFLDRCERTRPQGSILVVTHGVTIRAFRCLLEGWDHDRADAEMASAPPPNCGVTAYEREGDALVLRGHNAVYYPAP